MYKKSILMLILNQGMDDMLPQLYNPGTDIGEKSNVATQNPIIVKELSDLLNKIRVTEGPGFENLGGFHKL